MLTLETILFILLISKMVLGMEGVTVTPGGLEVSVTSGTRIVFALRTQNILK